MSFVCFDSLLELLSGRGEMFSTSLDEDEGYVSLLDTQTALFSTFSAQED